VTDSAAAAPGQTPAPEQSGLSEAQRITNLFFSPTKTFTDLKRKASWIAPLILLSIISYAFMGAVAQKVGFAQANENQMRMNPKQAERMDAMPPDQRQRAMDIGVTFTKVIFYVYPLLIILFSAIIAAALMATFNFGLGAEVSFGTSMAIVMYASLTGAVKILLAIISLYAGASPESFTFDNPVASNLGALVDVTQHPALYRLLWSVDIFPIWAIILLGIGFACVSKVKRASAITTVASWYLLVTLVRVGMAAIFS